MKSGLTPNPKNSGISELWNDPSFGVDLPRLNTDKRQITWKVTNKAGKKTYGIRMQAVSWKGFPGGICEVLDTKGHLEWQLNA